MKVKDDQDRMRHRRAVVTWPGKLLLIQTHRRTQQPHSDNGLSSFFSSARWFIQMFCNHSSVFVTTTRKGNLNLLLEVSRTRRMCSEIFIYFRVKTAISCRNTQVDEEEIEDSYVNNGLFSFNWMVAQKYQKPFVISMVTDTMWPQVKITLSQANFAITLSELKKK